MQPKVPNKVVLSGYYVATREELEKIGVSNRARYSKLISETLKERNGGQKPNGK